KKNPCRKKFRKDVAKRKRWRFLSDFYSKILPIPCGIFSPYYKRHKEHIKKPLIYKGFFI
ncbi:TPA: hypothetical protein ACQUHH_005804, partial [Bacillus mobilis]